MADKHVVPFRYDLLKTSWSRIQNTIQIKKYLNSVIKEIFKQKSFYTKMQFQNFVVTLCIYNYEDLSITLDYLEISKRTSPALLMRELYELCKKHNPILSEIYNDWLKKMDL